MNSSEILYAEALQSAPQVCASHVSLCGSPAAAASLWMLWR